MQESHKTDEGITLVFEQWLYVCNADIFYNISINGGDLEKLFSSQTEQTTKLEEQLKVAHENKERKHHIKNRDIIR